MKERDISDILTVQAEEDQKIFDILDTIGRSSHTGAEGSWPIFICTTCGRSYDASNLSDECPGAAITEVMKE